MKDSALIEKRLANHIPEGSEKEIRWATFNAHGVSMLRIRDYLIKQGLILEEDLNRNIYIAKFDLGLFKMSSSIVGLLLDGDKVVMGVYSKEGLIKRNIANKTIDMIKEFMNKYND